MSVPPLLLPAAVSVAAVTYTTVLFAELVGDKSLYTIAALGLRCRLIPVFAGIALAFMGKMLAAVLFGRMILRVPVHWTNLLSAAGFFACALLIWIREPTEDSLPPKREARWLHAFAISFGAIFLTEWADPGQIAAAALAAHSRELMAVWLGGSLALLTKGALAMILGARLGSLIPARLIRVAACASYCVLGIISLAQLAVH